ncbi:hypothetical protein [Saliphagus sp. LR7]|uniref:hypothetical protein n=1 Tax=Saliphagus sp. LR7 TaxID=2282654 RepID=UPI000DF7A0F2|nr:hypothetical protein [Saliphagus sp. LR7]
MVFGFFESVGRGKRWGNHLSVTLLAVAIREPLIEAATAGDGPQSSPVATDGGLVVGDDEVLEDEVETDGEESDDCDLLLGNCPCAHCYVEEGAE